MSKAILDSALLALKRFSKSVWLFPGLCAGAVLILTALQISGSSIGIYHSFFYGGGKDSSLLLNKPRAIRSDEWLTNTQMTIAQKKAGFPRINHNIGNGEDMSVIFDAPYKDWSMAFKPHNLVFFILPLGYALAFKWWLMGFLLVVSCYFFVLLLMPGKRLFAALFSLALFFSPFVQWWYQYITLGSLYYCFLLALAYAYLLRAKRLSHSILSGALIAYLLICFALILYPPFQIACALAIGAFIIGYSVEKVPGLDRKQTLTKLGILVSAGLLAGAVILLFLHSNAPAVSAIRHSSYPGHRVVLSGGFDDVRLLTSNLAFQFQFTSKAAAYYFPVVGIANQSESSNFLYIMPFLFLPGLFLLITGWRRSKKIDWPLLITSLLFVVFMMRLFFAHFDPLFKLLLLDNVPHNRLLIGTGLLGVIYFVLVARNLVSAKLKPRLQGRLLLLAYAMLVFLVEIVLGLTVRHRAPGFVSIFRLVLFAVPFPVIIYLVLNKRFSLAAAGLLLFSMFCSGGINPLYRGTGVLTNTLLAKDMQALSKTYKARWVTENSYLENYALLNGAASLSGTYAYPQLSLWQDIPGAALPDYNRFAHVDFSINHGPAGQPTSLALRGNDSFLVTTDACSTYLKRVNVHFIVTSGKLPGWNACATLIKTETYPTLSLYIYRLD
jgi:hypothetical protein